MGLFPRWAWALLLGVAATACGSGQGLEEGRTTPPGGAGPTQCIGGGDAPPLGVIAAGTSMACVARGCMLACWGSNGGLVTGNPFQLDWIDAPYLRALPAVARDLEVFASRGCILGTDSTAYCFGEGNLGRLDNNASVKILPVEGLGPVKELAAQGIGCALDPDDRVMCWGEFPFGPYVEPTYFYEPTFVGATGTHAATGGGHGCVIDGGGGVACWGDLTAMFAGAGDAVAAPQAIPGMPVVTTVRLDVMHGCAIDASQRVVCWGYNEHGVVGHGAKDSIQPPGVVEGPTAVVQISVNAHVCAVTEGGDVWCWGWNASDELGIPSASFDFKGGIRRVGVINETTPGAVQVAAGAEHTCALLRDGTVWCWGNNWRNALGRPGAGGPVPAPVQGLPALGEPWEPSPAMTSERD